MAFDASHITLNLYTTQQLYHFFLTKKVSAVFFMLSWEEFNWKQQGVDTTTSITRHYNIICSALKHDVFLCFVGMCQGDDDCWRTCCTYVFTQHNPIINTSHSEDPFWTYILKCPFRLPVGRGAVKADSALNEYSARHLGVSAQQEGKGRRDVCKPALL